MNPNSLSRSLALLAAGAVISGASILLSREREPAELRIASDQLDALARRLDRLQEALQAPREAPAPVRPAESAVAPPPTRREEPDPRIAPLLEEIRDLLHHAFDPAAAAADPAAPRAGGEALAKEVEATSGDATALTRNEFCRTKSQIYARFGYPDATNSTATSSQWTYRLADCSITFTFVDGSVDHVNVWHPNR
jgi:hypothetical protein